MTNTPLTRAEKIDTLIDYWWQAMTERDLHAFFIEKEREEYAVLDDAQIDAYYADIFEGDTE